MEERKYTLTVFKNRRVPIGSRLELTWPEIVEKFKTPEITEETFDEYQAMTNEQKTDVKDVGGYVAGELTANRRSKTALVSRSIITIDVDDAPSKDWMFGYSCLFIPKHLIHSTHTSTKEHPRFRILIPLTRPVNADEYRYLAQRLADEVGLEAVDGSTDQPERLMFWPSIPFDGEYIFYENGNEFLDPDKELPEDFVQSLPTIQKDKPIENGVLEVGEGQRNKTVFSFAATLRGNGLDQSGIRAILEEYNDRYCSPPLEAWELDTICRSVCSRYQPGEAVAASLRDAWDDFNDLGEWKETKPAPIKHLEAESLASLNGRHVDAPVYVVDSLIANGITILASPPKFGKSWMCMDLAISVANGTEFMGLTTHKEGVIYLALEDGDYRLQERGRKVAGDRPIPDNLYLVKEAPQLQDGLLSMLNALVESCESVGMVIIDTLQKVRGVAGKTEGVYGYDYRELGQLHKYALDNNLAVVLVHHLNKGGDDNDFVGRLNGSTGISGAADSIITLSRSKRGDNETKMSITGRDIVERTLILEMDWGRYRWTILGEEHDVESRRDELEFNSDPVVKTIQRMLDDNEELVLDDPEATEVVWSCTSAEFLAEMERLYGSQDISATSIGVKLKRLEPKLESELGITHEQVRKPGTGRRVHTFTREII